MLERTHFARRHRITHPAIYPIEAIAAFAGFVVKYAPLSGVHAILACYGAQAQIIVAEHLSLMARRYAMGADRSRRRESM